MTNDGAESADGVAVTEAVDAPSDEPVRAEEAAPDTSDDELETISADEEAHARVEPAEEEGTGGEVASSGAPESHPDPLAGDDEASGDAGGPADVERDRDDADVNDLLGLASALEDVVPDDDAGDVSQPAADDDALADEAAPDDPIADEAAPDGAASDETAPDEAAHVEPSHSTAHLLAPLVGASPRSRPAPVAETAEPVDPADAVLVARGLVKDFGGTHAVDEIDLTVPTGSFYGIVGPNGAGKTTTLSMISGLLRPDRGTITVAGIDARQRGRAAKKLIGVLPDRFRTFDRLTGRQLLHYYGLLRGLKPAVVDKRTADLARAFDLTDALGRAVSDYSAGMTKKVMLAGAMIHSPRLLVLDEPFEAVDPVSAAVILEILSQYVAGGGTVILSSHTMELVERVCSRVAVVVSGQVLAEGTVDEVRGDLTLEQRFVELSGGLTEVEGLEWLHTFSD